MDYRERGSRARGVYPTQFTSCMWTVRVKQEEEADTRIIRNPEERNVGPKGKSLKQGLTITEDLFKLSFIYFTKHMFNMLKLFILLLTDTK